MKEEGGFEEFFRDEFEDQVFFAKMKIRGQIFVSGECWDKSRLHPHSSRAVAAKAGRLASARPYSLNWLASYPAEQGVRDGGIWWALRAQLYRYPVLPRPLQIRRHPAREAAEFLKRLVRRTLPPPMQRRLREAWRGRGGHPEVGEARLGDLRRVTPFSRRFGFDRGLPVDRYYIERFLVAHAHDVRGRVLEIKDNKTFARDDRRRLFALGNRLWHSDSSFNGLMAELMEGLRGDAEGDPRWRRED